MIQLFWQAARSLAKRPAFSLFVLLVLALCIGGNAAIFSATRAVLFQELPYKDLDRLVFLHGFFLPNSTETELSWLESIDWGERSQLVEEVTPFLIWQDRFIIDPDAVERIEVNYVPPQFFDLLGIRLQLGRPFNEQDNGPPGSATSVIISDDLWERRYARDPQILGKEIRLNSRVFTVIGVMPKGYRNFLEWRYPYHHDAWIPANMAGDPFRPGTPVFESRDQRLWFTVGRLKPGVTLEQARKEAEGIGAQFAREFPDSNKDYVARVTPLRQYMFADVWSGTKILLVGAFLVLLIGCANIANLLLVRMAERRRELSLRLSLGASRWQLIQQVFAESAVLAVVGGALGVLVAYWCVQLLDRFLALPEFVRVELDGTVLAVSLFATLLTCFLFALPPALSVSRMESKGVLQQIRSGGRTYSTRGRSGLLVVQTAIVVVLLVVAGLLLRSFWSLQSTGVGMKTDNLLTMRISFGTERYEDRPQIAAALKELVREIEEVPGVDGAAAWVMSTPGLSTQFTDILADGTTSVDATVRSDFHRVSPGALGLLGVPLLQGRDFTAQDTADTPRVTIISKSLADVLWPGQDPIGKQIYRPGMENDLRMTVVGVIRDTRFEGRFTEGNHDVLITNEQSPALASPMLLVSTKVAESAIVPRLRAAIKAVDPQIPVYSIISMNELLREEERAYRLNAAVVGLYSAFALTLALLGLYSMLAYSVIQRTSEIGVRLALGADRPKVVRMVMANGLVLALSGVAIGVVGALLITRFLSTVLYGVEVRDPLTFIIVVALFTLVALLATYLPARRTVRVDPTVALRFE